MQILGNIEFCLIDERAPVSWKLIKYTRQESSMIHSASPQWLSLDIEVLGRTNEHFMKNSDHYRPGLWSASWINFSRAVIYEKKSHGTCTKSFKFITSLNYTILFKDHVAYSTKFDTFRPNRPRRPKGLSLFSHWCPYVTYVRPEGKKTGTV